MTSNKLLALEEIEKMPEWQKVKAEFGPGKDYMEDYMKDCKRKHEGFIDPFMFGDPLRREQVYDTLRNVPLRELLGGGTGSDFMSYLVPTKVYQVILDAYREDDILDKISGMVLRDVTGSGNVYVNWGLFNKIWPKWGSGIGSAAIETEQFDRVALDPKSFRMDLCISKDLLEDSPTDLIEYHVRAAGKEMQSFAVCEALKAMYEGHDQASNQIGSGASGAVTVANFITAKARVISQGGIPDTAVITTEQEADILGDTTTFDFSNAFKDAAVRGEIMAKFLKMNWYTRVKNTVTSGLYTTHTGFSRYYAMVFEKARSLAVAWKRPITITNYDAPREGLAGAFATGRIGFGVLCSGDYISTIVEGA